MRPLLPAFLALLLGLMTGLVYVYVEQEAMIRSSTTASLQQRRESSSAASPGLLQTLWKGGKALAVPSGGPEGEPVLTDGGQVRGTVRLRVVARTGREPGSNSDGLARKQAQPGGAAEDSPGKDSAISLLADGHEVVEDPEENGFQNPVRMIDLVNANNPELERRTLPSNLSGGKGASLVDSGGSNTSPSSKAAVGKRAREKQQAAAGELHQSRKSLSKEDLQAAIASTLAERRSSAPQSPCEDAGDRVTVPRNMGRARRASEFPAPETVDLASFPPSSLPSLFASPQPFVPGGPPRLTKELAYAHAEDGIVLVTLADASYVPFAVNFADYLSLLDAKGFLVGVLDAEAARMLEKEKLPIFAMYGENGPDGVGREGLSEREASLRLGRQSVDLVRTLLRWGLNVVLTDVDTVWMRMPNEYFEWLVDADMLSSSEALSASSTDENGGLEHPAEAFQEKLSTGIVYFRARASTVAFVDAWYEALLANPSVADSVMFNQLVKSGLEGLPALYKLHPNNPRVVYCWDERLAVGVLPITTFSNGHAFFVQKLYLKYELYPFVVHATHTFGGPAAKRHRLRDSMLWIDTEEYYNETEKFMSVIFQLPPTAKNFTEWEEDAMVKHHLYTMRLQLDQFAIGMAIALAMERTLIMPSFVCYCDRAKVPLKKCRLPNAQGMKLPFNCPLDQVVDPGRFDDNPALYGMPVPYKESGFLFNSRTPWVVKVVKYAEAKDKVVELRPGGSEVKGPTWGDSLLTIPSGPENPPVTDQELLRLSRNELGNSSLIILRSLGGLWDGFVEAAREESFMKRLTHLPGEWCCDAEGKGVPYKLDLAKGKRSLPGFRLPVSSLKEPLRPPLPRILPSIE